MSAYILPQIQVFQEYRATPSFTTDHNPFIFGPHYFIKRDEGIGEYDRSQATEYDYPLKPSNADVDTSWFTLYFKNLIAQYYEIQNDASYPMFASDPVSKNKLRASPYIQDGELAAATIGLGIETTGFYKSGIELPENYYFVPYGGWDGTAWDEYEFVSDIGGDEDGVLSYYTTEGFSGTVEINADDDPLTAGNHVTGPDGILFDCDVGERKSGVIEYTSTLEPEDADTVKINNITFTFKTTPAVENDVQVVDDNGYESFENLKKYILAKPLTGITEIYHTAGVDEHTGTFRVIGDSDWNQADPSNQFSYILDGDVAADVDVEDYTAIRAPATIYISDSTKASWFSIKINEDKIKDAIDAAIDDSKPLTITVDIDASATTGVSFDSANKAFSIDVDSSPAVTLATLRALLVADSDVSTWLTVSAITGTSSADVALVYDEMASEYPNDFAINMIRDCYRVKIGANPYVFCTGNDVNHSSHFLQRGVKVGDTVKWEVTDNEGVVQDGLATVVGFEAEQTRNYLEDPEYSEYNMPSYTATVLGYKSGADVIIPGDDNQYTFEGANTRLVALDPILHKFIGEYNNGVISDNILITITTAGAVGTAKAKVESTTGTYSRTNVPIIAAPSGDSSEAALYLGRNLWAVLDNTTVAAAVFAVGDTYTLSANVDTDFTAIGDTVFSAAGEYVGSANTTYVLEVVRGGVFDRNVHQIDGIVNANKFTIPISDLDDSGAGNGNGIKINSVTVEERVTKTVAALVTAINESTADAYADADATYLNIYGSYKLSDQITYQVSGTGAYVSTHLVANYVRFASTMSFDTDWNLGDLNDEYILTCTTAGDIATAAFSCESLRNDTETGIKFYGSGASYVSTIGSQGLRGYLSVSGTITFAVGDTIILRVSAARPQVKITDTIGSDQSSLVTVNDDTAFNVGLNGVTATFTANTNTEGGFSVNGGLVKGDIYYVEAVAAEDSALKTLILSDDLPDNINYGQLVEDGELVPGPDASRFGVTLYAPQSSVLITEHNLYVGSGYNYELSEDEITINAGIRVQDSSWYELDGTQPWIPVYSADMEVTYRALSQDYSDTIYSIGDISDVESELGEISPDNPLSQGVYMSLLNGGSKSTYFMAVPTNDHAGYLSVLDRAALNDIIYAFAPLSVDSTIQASVLAHVAAMSEPEEKKWRIVFLGNDLPTEIAVYNLATNLDEEEWLAKVTHYATDPDDEYRLLTITNGEPEALSEVAAGDQVRIRYSVDAWGDEEYETFEVSSILSNTTMLLTETVGTAIPTAVKFELWHPYSVGERATAVATKSASYASKRAIAIFPSYGYSGSTLLDSVYMAASVAGLTCSVAPQQGLTNVEIQGFTDLSLVYKTFTKDQLNEIAAAGTLILMQDAPTGRVYVRHQLTTARLDDNLNTTELSMVKNLDNVSYYFTNLFAPYIGRYNITDNLIQQLRSLAHSGLAYMEDMTSTGLLGPQLLKDGTELVELKQHPTLKDHIIATINIALPPPFNVMQLYLVV